MNRFIAISILLPVLNLAFVSSAGAEARRDGGDQALRKAQYMLRQLNQENSQLKARVAELEQENEKVESKLEDLKKEQNTTESRLEKSRENNEQLVERIRSDLERYKELLARYREAVSTLRQANADNQYLVKAVREREAWIEECRGRNSDLFATNRELLEKYRDLAVEHAEPVTGIGKVRVENEFQDYRFKLEDLQVTQFQSSVNTAAHSRSSQPGDKQSRLD